MAVVFIEGFDICTLSSQIVQKGWNSTFGTASGRFDGQSAQFATTSTTRTKSLPSSYATLIAGFAFQTNARPANADFYVLRSGATATARLSFDASGHLQVRNSGGTVIATGTTVVSLNVWHYIEMKIFINGASGTCEVHLDGVSEITSTVGNFGSVNLDSVLLQGLNSGTQLFDDLYVCDTTGSAPNNTFLGDVRVESVYPNGAGSHSQWTPNGASPNYACVDEEPPNDDTDYVSDNTVGHLDTYATGDIDGGATVYGVQVNVWARKDDAATRQIAPVIRESGTDYVGTTVTLGATYTYYSQLYDQDPTPAAWTATNFNNAEFGVKEIA